MAALNQQVENDLFDDKGKQFVDQDRKQDDDQDPKHLPKVQSQVLGVSHFREKLE